MNPLTSYLSLIKAGVTVLVLVAVFGLGWKVNGDRWERKFKQLELAFITFKVQVAAMGEQAKEDALRQNTVNKQVKERADAQNTTTIAALRADVRRLRDEADRTRRSGVPAAPADSSRPDLFCVDRAEYIRAYGEAAGRLRAGVRSLADEGSKATVDLNTAKQWAGEVRLKLSTTLKE